MPVSQWRASVVLLETGLGCAVENHEETWRTDGRRKLRDNRGNGGDRWIYREACLVSPSIIQVAQLTSAPRTQGLINSLYVFAQRRWPTCQGLSACKHAAASRRIPRRTQLNIEWLFVDSPILRSPPPSLPHLIRKKKERKKQDSYEIGWNISMNMYEQIKSNGKYKI